MSIPVSRYPTWPGTNRDRLRVDYERPGKISPICPGGCFRLLVAVHVEHAGLHRIGLLDVAARGHEVLPELRAAAAHAQRMTMR